MTAAICATSRASPRRSSRAISESLSVAGTAALSSPADSITLLVNSSTNSGTPSVLATIAATVSADRPCAAATPATSWAHSARPRRPERQQGRLRPRQPGRREIRPRGHQGKQIAPGRCCRPSASSIRAWWHRSSARPPAPAAPDRSRPRRTISSTRSAMVAALRCAGVSDMRRRRRRDRQQFSQQRNRGCVRRRPLANKAPSFSMRASAASPRRQIRRRDRDAG